MNYQWLMSQNPTKYDSMTNSIGQQIDFYEHPTKGDSTFVLCVCHELKLADYSTFMETDDMMASHGEYEPSFQDGMLWIGDSPAND